MDVGKGSASGAPSFGFWDLELVALGVALPALTLAFELCTGMCGEVYSSPIPTPWHVALVALVPLCNWFAWDAARRGVGGRLAVAALANGLTLATTAFYTFFMAPLMPVSVIGVVFYGLGLLPWSPFLALVAAAQLRGRLARAARSQERPLPGLALALALGVTTLVLGDLRATATRVGLHLGASPDPATAAAGLDLLRRVGAPRIMAAACEWRPIVAPEPADMLLSLLDGAVPPSRARELLWLAAALTPEEVPHGSVGPLFGNGRGFGRWRRGDEHVASSTVGTVLPDLSLAESSMDGSVDPAAALAYLEWTLVLRNDGPSAQEGRAHVAVPPGAVVSRLTLWIDGEPREAAFAGRAEVREAYRSVVARRRDPVLVTTAGRDRLLVQCFPVPAGGTMRFRLGLTCPLALTSLAEGRLALPRFADRNFSLPAGLSHAVWVEASDRPAGNLRRVLSEEEIQGACGALLFPRDPACTVAVAVAADAEPGFVVRQVLAVEPVPPLARLVVVVDGGAALAGRRAEVDRSLAALQTGREVRVLMDAAPHRGGVDAVPPLEQAWDLAAAEGGAVLWLHGPQPLTVRAPGALLQRFVRRPDGPRLFVAPLAGGRNVVREELDSVAEPLPGNDLPAALANLPGSRPGTAVVPRRERLAAGAVPATAARTSDHLVRLRARDEVERLAGSADAAERARAVELAGRLRLVTTVSGAVVLETAQQYQEAGLDPSTPGKVPTIPEPETWALALLTLAVMASTWRRRALPCTRA